MADDTAETTRSRATSRAQKDTIGRVMHAFKHADLEGPGGTPVTNPRQAIAIALREAGASNRATPEENRSAFRRTRRQERATRSGATKAALYAEAKRRNIPGRSRMSRGELEQALNR
ncbi:hypothetical protein OPKNFCMD_3140 [Methylobacterium crusticola]|uniref:Plasmid stabilization protein n=1 Tax=Methylobacterium crusticola TaxID=1697972 RepID=A0ABQ4QYF2_9HYPH|nr:hypothetical protein [Methylobacterium crusticola]GJD50401.1 hypothetical protein OPKNFCMD_3140 [Methylobacterium crusticola]